MRADHRHRRRARAWPLPGLLILAVAGCVTPSGSTGPDGGAVPDDRPPPVSAPAVSRAPAQTASAAPDGAVDDAVAVSIPTIGVSGGLIGLGLTDDGALEVPEDGDQLGWFTGGARPGERGPTVIAGHVDSERGPAVFHRLPELKPGDRIEVETADGREITYIVERVSVHPKGDFPTEDVFGATATDELRLITCTGPWMDAEASYRDNHVVFATAAQ